MSKKNQHHDEPSIPDTAAESRRAPLLGAQPVEDAAASAYHERWLLLDAENQALTADAALSQVAVALKFGYLVLKAPGMLRLDVPLEVIEDDESVLRTVNLNGRPQRVADEGNWAAAWFSQLLGKPVRLVKRMQ